jgi:NAD(P)-dependent dehydrogenase (short-subunit alcohol dehydrogenase family)
VVVVAGASAGIDRGTARAFARRGARIGLIARDKLFEPVRGDFGAHGRFDAQSRPASTELWLSTHRTLAGEGC